MKLKTKIDSRKASELLKLVSCEEFKTLTALLETEQAHHIEQAMKKNSSGNLEGMNKHLTIANTFKTLLGLEKLIKAQDNASK